MTLRRALATTSIAAATLGLNACVALADRPRHEKEVDLSIAHVDATMLRIEGRNGGISVSPHQGDTVEIDARIYGSNQARVDAVTVHAEREKDGALRVWAQWPTDPKGNEGVTFAILIPSTAGIDADTSNGPITITGLAGPYILDTSNGPIEVDGATGDVRADTSNGSITINGTPAKVLADTSNGNIRIASATGPVTLDSSNGNIEVVLAETNPGPVVADTSNGSIVLAVGPAFGGSIIADTSNGKVRFGPFPPAFAASVTEVENDTVRATFGTATHKSRLDTSNGGITIRPTSDG